MAISLASNAFRSKPLLWLSSISIPSTFSAPSSTWRSNICRKRGVPKAAEDDSNTAKKPDIIYSIPQLYDLAFGYRNYEEEVEFLITTHKSYSQQNKSGPSRIIELAAGPTRHSLAALSGYSSEEDGIENADLELDIGGGRRENFAYLCGDMRQIERSRSNNDAATDLYFDAVWLLLGSMQHLLANDDIIACFESINSSIVTAHCPTDR